MPALASARTDAVSTVRGALIHGLVLGVGSFISFSLITQLLVRLYTASPTDDLLGGMWAVIATLFVYRYTYDQSVSAAVSRMAATLVSFALCFVYLLVLPFQPWGLALLIGVGAVVMMLVGRPDDVVTTAITTAVVMVVAAISPHDAWHQPILRLFDSVVGTSVGLAGAWLGLRLAPRVEREFHHGE